MPNNFLTKTVNVIKADFKNSFLGGQITLQDSTSKPVNLSKTGTFVCIQPDKKIKDWKNNFPFFETSVVSSCSVSDHLIFYPKKDKLFVFIVELKSSNPTGAISQVRASLELSKYICGTVSRLLNYPKTQIEYRGLIFSSKTPFKGNTKSKNLGYFDDPISNLKFRHLQSGNNYDLDVLSI